MKRRVGIVIAALIACSGLIHGVAAQEDADRPEEGAPDIFEQPTEQPVPEEPTLLYATQLIGEADVHAEALAAMPEVSGVEVIDLDTLPGEEAFEPLMERSVEEFLLRHRDRIDLLRGAVADNPAVAQALQEAGVEPADIVAAEVRPDLALRVFAVD